MIRSLECIKRHYPVLINSIRKSESDILLFSHISLRRMYILFLLVLMIACLMRKKNSEHALTKTAIVKNRQLSTYVEKITIVKPNCQCFLTILDYSPDRDELVEQRLLTCTKVENSFWFFFKKMVNNQIGRELDGKCALAPELEQLFQIKSKMVIKLKAWLPQLFFDELIAALNQPENVFGQPIESTEMPDFHDFLYKQPIISSLKLTKLHEIGRLVALLEPSKNINKVNLHFSSGAPILSESVLMMIIIQIPNVEKLTITHDDYYGIPQTSTTLCTIGKYCNLLKRLNLGVTSNPPLCFDITNLADYETSLFPYLEYLPEIFLDQDRVSLFHFVQKHLPRLKTKRHRVF